MRCMGTVRVRLLSGSLARELVDAPLLELLRCPFCRAGLADADGALACTGCGRSFAVENGIPLMLHQDLPGATEKLGETAGWVEKARAEGWYEPDDTVDAVLPFVNRDLGWDDLTWLGERPLVPGPARPLHRRRRGAARARGRGRRRHGPRASGSSATASTWPPTSSSTRRSASAAAPSTATSAACRPTASTCRSADAAFDVVYCVATLHHALDLPQMVREMARVARRGAVVCGLNEGTRSVSDAAPTTRTRRARRRSGSTSTCTPCGRTRTRSPAPACSSAGSSARTAGRRRRTAAASRRSRRWE